MEREIQLCDIEYLWALAMSAIKNHHPVFIPVFKIVGEDSF